MISGCHSKVKDIAGQTFDRLTVVGFAEMRSGEAHWHCRCLCGTEKVVNGVRLRSGALMWMPGPRDHLQAPEGQAPPFIEDPLRERPRVHTREHVLEAVSVPRSAIPQVPSLQGGE
jgi:hypothetical protein